MNWIQLEPNQILSFTPRLPSMDMAVHQECVYLSVGCLWLYYRYICQHYEHRRQHQQALTSLRVKSFDPRRSVTCQASPHLTSSLKSNLKAPLPLNKRVFQQPKGPKVYYPLTG